MSVENTIPEQKKGVTIRSKPKEECFTEKYNKTKAVSVRGPNKETEAME
jgi:hypothetical protein